MWHSNTRNKTYTQDDVDYYRRQAEDAQAELEREWQKQREERERRRREREQMYEDRLREATNWQEALRHQAILMDRECWTEEEIGDPNLADDRYFEDGRDACKRALELYGEVEKELQPELDELQRQLEQLQFEIRRQTGERLLAEQGERGSGWKYIATSLMDQELVPEEWLNW